MFPTTGLFQEFQCPMFKTGSCDRPYCHFNHLKNPTTPVSEDKESTKVVRTDPVYRPTPISELEKRYTRDISQNHLLNDINTIPVYQPTPIKELDKYTPNSLAMYKLPKETAVFLEPAKPPEVPTYSPVVRRAKVSHQMHPSTVNADYATDSSMDGASKTKPFVYQPSPAYPPLINEEGHETVISTTLSEQIKLNSCSDEDESIPDCLNATSLNHGDFVCSEIKYDTNNDQEQSTENDNNGESEKHLSGSLRKRKSSSKSKLSQFMQPKTPNDEVEVVGKGVLENESRSESPEEDKVKRQKLMSLYQDLYGSEPLPSANNAATGTIEKKSAKPIQPARITGASTASASTKSEVSTIRSSDATNCPSTPAADTVEKTVLRPITPLRKSDKIPMPIRTRYLDQFIEECLVIYESPADAYNRALVDEQACHDKATSRMAYLNAVISQLKSLKNEKLKVQGDGIKKAPSKPRHQQLPSLAASSSTTKKCVLSMDDQLDAAVQGPQLYAQLTPYILSQEDLISNGYPREDKKDGAPRGRAVLTVPEDKQSLYSSLAVNERICCRCGLNFTVDDFGNALMKQKCVYHWGRPIKQRTPGFGVDLRYPCCQGEIGQQGCQICPAGHVHQANKWFDRDGFVATLPPLVPMSSTSNDCSSEDRVNVYALDCEMVYTTAGCELARITVVDSRCQPVMDYVVRPDSLVIDCNTRFSGLHMSDIEAASDHLTDIQSRLLHLFDSDTILIGHSLESDLVALKLVHSRVVDTSVMYPHRLGPPKKRALRNLVGEILQRIIQQNESGHNSLEDAVACLQLVHQRVKEDLRRGKWIIK